MAVWWRIEATRILVPSKAYVVETSDFFNGTQDWDTEGLYPALIMEPIRCSGIADNTVPYW